MPGFRRRRNIEARVQGGFDLVAEAEQLPRAKDYQDAYPGQTYGNKLSIGIGHMVIRPLYETSAQDLYTGRHRKATGCVIRAVVGHSPALEVITLHLQPKAASTLVADHQAVSPRMEGNNTTQLYRRGDLSRIAPEQAVEKLRLFIPDFEEVVKSCGDFRFVEGVEVPSEHTPRHSQGS